jgi:hypothetical protein
MRGATLGQDIKISSTLKELRRPLSTLIRILRAPRKPPPPQSPPTNPADEPEAPCDLHQRINRRRLFAPLDFTNEITMQVRFFRQPFLAYPRFLA